MSNQELGDELSLTYSVFAMCLQRSKAKYQAERDYRKGLLKRQSDDEEEG